MVQKSHLVRSLRTDTFIRSSSGTVLVAVRMLVSFSKSKFKEEDYELLNQIREIRNYWCHQCYIDFHYIEGLQAHEKAFQKVADRLHEDELHQKIEKLRKSVEKKHKHKKGIQ